MSHISNHKRSFDCMTESPSLTNTFGSLSVGHHHGEASLLSPSASAPPASCTSSASAHHKRHFVRHSHQQNHLLSSRHFSSRPSRDIASEVIDSLFSKRKRSRLEPGFCDTDSEEPFTSQSTQQQPQQQNFHPSLPSISSSSFVHTSPPHTESEQKYTKVEVRVMLESALQDLEVRMREQYDGLLQDHLAEQFQNFSRFNQDFVSLQMNTSPFEYVS
eukprot:c8449_g1_i1.p1 GENE.c8449_g1_i1~~c8449_g1_i1.p1  ORF type:complete len:217 (+),score=41.05 c8449_g1_i1:71-721(+)